MMFSENNNLSGAGRILAVLALIGAILSAQYVGNTTAWVGIMYYLVCIAAIIFKHPWAKNLTWGAVGFHVVLVSYSLWNWFTGEIPPCPYCFMCAGLALFAATALQRTQMAVFPVLLITAAWFSWPYAFAGEDYDVIPTGQTNVTQEVQPAEAAQAVSSEPGDGNDGASQPAATSAGSSTGSTESTPFTKQTATVSPKGNTQPTANSGLQPGDTDVDPDTATPVTDNAQPKIGNDPVAGDNTATQTVTPPGDSTGTKTNPAGSDKPAKPQPP